MNLTVNLKKIIPLMVLFALVIGALNFGSYDPRNELSSLTPNNALATWWNNDSSSCEIWTDNEELYVGADAVVSWWVEDGFSVTINGESVSGNSKVYPNLQNDTTFKLVATNAEGKYCKTEVEIECLPVPPPSCTIEPANSVISKGGSVDLSWASKNAVEASISNGIGGVELNGSVNTGPVYADSWFVMTVTNSNGETAECVADVIIDQTPDPICEWIGVTDTIITKGNSTNLSWKTINADRVVIDNAIGEVWAEDSLTITPLASTIYTLTAFHGDKSVNCKVEVVVKEVPVDEVSQCLSFTATPSSLPVRGGNTTLAWTTENATNVSIEPNIGAVALNGSTSVNVSQDTTYTLTASDDHNSNSCKVVVDVEEKDVTPSPITCEDNVNFSANVDAIPLGGSTVLSWSTTGITGVSFDNNITATGLNGSVSVTPSVSTSYTLTATDGKNTINCPISISVTVPSNGGNGGGGGGGGGGGSSSPRCELSISDKKIERGEEIELTWDSSRAGNLTIVDDHGETIVTTEDLLGSKKDELFDGSIKLSPTEDTTYTMTVERGSRDRVCEVEVEVEDDDNIVITEVREQQPLIAGISLTEVPYTGFEAGPILTVLFYTLLIVWALYVAYLFVIHRGMVDGFRLTASSEASLKSHYMPNATFGGNGNGSNDSERSSGSIPGNLPGATEESHFSVADNLPIAHDASLTDEEVTEIENRAHTKKVLLSSDAIRHFIANTDRDDRTGNLDKVIEVAKTKYPLEDGWLVINESKMQEVCSETFKGDSKEDSQEESENKEGDNSESKEKDNNSGSKEEDKQESYQPTVLPEGSGSLAEAIVIGNIVNAYELIGNRPMFALADAAADLDSVYRTRKGGEETVSDLLMNETKRFSDEQILEMIHALTSALDGTYDDESEAVKMAVMKAVKVSTHN